MSYKPLPDSLTIKESPIHGLGVFAKEDINTLNKLCDSHLYIKNGHFPMYKHLIRLEVGGYINHSKTPNTEIRRIEAADNEISSRNNNLRFYGLYPTKEIKAGEELTLDYTKEYKLTDYKEEEWLN